MSAYQSKYGFHPCSKEFFLKLRRLNFLAFEARRQIAAWKRWDRKDPNNRRKFIDGKDGWEGAKRNTIPKEHRVYEPLPEPVRPPLDLVTAGLIAADFQNARIPVVAAHVKMLMLSDQKVQSLLNLLEEWYVMAKSANVSKSTTV